MYNFYSIAVPDRIFPILLSSAPNPVRPIGSAVALTCTVYYYYFPPQIDIPVFLNIAVSKWDRGGLLLVANNSQLIMEGTTIYKFTVVISSFGRNQSGEYDCLPTLHSALNNTYIRGNIGYFYVAKVVTTGEIYIVHNII